MRYTNLRLLTYLLMTYRSINGTSPSYPQTCFTRVSDMTSRRRLRSSIPHIVWTFRRFVSLQSASGRFQFLVPLSGTACLSTSHLRRHSRFSDNDSRQFLFSRSYQATIMTRVLLLPFMTTICTTVVLAIINII